MRRTEEQLQMPAIFQILNSTCSNSPLYSLLCSLYMSEETLKIQNSYRNIIQLALPISVAIFIPQISMFLNTLFLGYYQPTQGNSVAEDLLAASGIAGIYHLTMVMFGYGLVSGMLMLMSRKAGEENKSGLMRIFSNGIVLCIVFGSALSFISFLLSPYLFQTFIHNPNVQRLAVSFIQIRIWAVPIMMLCQLSNSYYIATSQSKRIIYGSASQALSNVLFDYLLIFGIGFFPEMGLQGAALASVISEIIFLLVAYTIFFKKQDAGSIRSIFSNRIDWVLQKEILIKASPLMVQYLLSIGAWEVFFIFVEHLGKSESAVSQILRSVFGIVGVAAWALASTCNSMVSNLIGQNRQAEVISMIKKISMVSFGFALILGLPLFLFPQFFLGLLTQDQHLVAVGYRSLQIVVVATWMLSISTIYFNGVVGTGNTRMNMIFEFIAIILYLIYCAYVIEYKKLPLPFAWGSEFVYWLSLFGMSTFYLHRTFTLKQVKR